MKKIKSLLLVFSLFVTVMGFAQNFDLLKVKDLSSFKVDMLSDEDISKIKIQIQQNGISENQLEQMALQRGLPSSELTKLRARLNRVDVTSINKKQESNAVSTARSYDSLYMSPNEFATKYNIDKSKLITVFGSELFSNNNLTFEPNLRIPTPKNYIVGPDDEIVIDVYGYQEVNHKLMVSPEGSINIPNVGLIPVTGLTVEMASKRIKDKMIKSGYNSIASGQSFIQISIGRIRSIKVTVIGEVKKPGSYTLPSLSTLFNALYASGGPTEKGSLREIEVVRNGAIVVKMDAYEFLLKGDQTKNIRLMDQDVVRVPMAKIQITIKGEIKKPAIFEVLPKDNLQQVFDYAGGFNSAAYKASVHVTQYTDKERSVKDVAKTEFNMYKPQNGDEIVIGKVLERFENRVQIKGAVYMPGYYELSPNLTVSKLIEKANGLREDAFVSRGLIVRTNPQTLQKEALSFGIKDVFSSPSADISLRKNDEVVIGDAQDFKDSATITVEGQVKKPGVYNYYKNQSLKDVLFEAGGFTEGSSIDRIEIGRRVDGNDSSSKKISEVIVVNLDKELNIKGNDITLKPWDVIMVRNKPSYKPQILVKTEGEINYPGAYVLTTKDEKVSDLIKRAGGLTKQAFLKGIQIKRININASKDTLNIALKKIQQQTKDSTNTVLDEEKKATVTIGLDVEAILKDPGGLEDIILQEGDLLIVPSVKREIRVSGEVLFPTDVVYKEGESLKYYIERAGGFTDLARKSKVYVIQPNGVAAKTRKFLFFRSFPKVEAGSEILVPKRNENLTKRMTLAETVGITSAIASLAGVVIAIINVTKK